MSELAEVRRYWPKAKMSCQLLADGAVVWTLYAADRSERLRIVVYADGRAAAGKWAMATRLRPTIAAAMRAARFGPRPPSGFLNGFKRNDCAGRILPGCRIKPHKWHTPLVDRQRPRKGARLGQRKRTGWDKEDARQFAQWRGRWISCQ